MNTTSTTGETMSEKSREVVEVEAREASTLPRWEPEEGKAFIAAVVAVDRSRVGHTLYVLAAAHDVVCRGRGITEVTVPAGQQFVLPVDAMLSLEGYVGLGNVGIASVKKIKMGDGTPAWQWSVRTSAAQKAKLEAARGNK